MRSSSKKSTTQHKRTSASAIKQAKPKQAKIKLTAKSSQRSAKKTKAKTTAVKKLNPFNATVEKELKAIHALANHSQETESSTHLFQKNNIRDNLENFLRTEIETIFLKTAPPTIHLDEKLKRNLIDELFYIISGRTPTNRESSAKISALFISLYQPTTHYPSVFQTLIDKIKENLSTDDTRPGKWRYLSSDELHHILAKKMAAGIPSAHKIKHPAQPPLHLPRRFAKSI